MHKLGLPGQGKNQYKPKNPIYGDVEGLMGIARGVDRIIAEAKNIDPNSINNLDGYISVKALGNRGHVSRQPVIWGDKPVQDNNGQPLMEYGVSLQHVPAAPGKETERTVNFTFRTNGEIVAANGAAYAGPDDQYPVDGTTEGIPNLITTSYLDKRRLVNQPGMESDVARTASLLAVAGVEIYEVTSERDGTMTNLAAQFVLKHAA